MTGAYNAGSKRLISTDCIVELSDSYDNVEIVITPETGYTYIRK